MASMMSNSNHTSFVIVINLVLTQMVSGKAFFARTSGTMFQGYGSVKLVRVNPSGDHSSYYHGHMNSDACLL